MSAHCIFNQQEISSSIILATDQNAIDHILEAQILIDLGEYDKSITYLNIISQKYKGDNVEVEARLLGGVARNYFKLGLNSKAVELWKDAINLIENSSESSYLKAVFNNNLAVAYIGLDETEKAEEYFQKSLKIFPLPETYRKLSELVLDKDKNFELSDFYLISGLALIKGTDVKYKPYLNDLYLMNLHSAQIIEGYANHYYVKEEFVTSLKKYEEVLAIAEDIQAGYLKIQILKKIGGLHRRMGNSEKSSEYLAKYVGLKDSLRVIKNNSLSIAVQNFIQEEDQQTPKQDGFKTVSKVIIIVIVSGVVFLIFIIYRKRKLSSELKIIENKHSSTGIKSVNLNLPLKTENELLDKLKEFEVSNQFLDKNTSFSVVVGCLNSNSKYLRQILKNHKNTDFISYINKLRIEYIINKLKTDPSYLNYKISYLAEECGFSSHSKFSASFKNITGLSPSTFIENLKDRAA